jgi:hypothetical protein
VDILFLMPVDEYYRYDKYVGNGQSQLLQDVKAIIQERYSTTDKIRGDGQVVVVPFKGGHTVELLPAWQARNGKYIVPDTHDGGRWNLVDHAAEIDHVDESDELSSGKTRHLIQMMKMWQETCQVPIKSLALELRAVNFMATWAHSDKDFHYYDWMVRDYLAELISKANSWCKIPGIEEKCYYGSEWLSRAKSAYQRALKACDFEADGKEDDATEEWLNIFGLSYEF